MIFLQIVGCGDRFTNVHEVSSYMDTICMKCQASFSMENKKNIFNLSSDFTKRVLKINLDHCLG